MTANEFLERLRLKLDSAEEFLAGTEADKPGLFAIAGAREAFAYIRDAFPELRDPPQEAGDE